MKSFLVGLIFLPNLVFAGVTIAPKNGQLYACNAGIAHPAQDLAGTDSIQVKYDDLSVAEDSPVRVRGNNISADFSDSYKVLFGGNSFWLSMISKLEIGLSSEKLGSRYYIDYCYVAPKASGPQLVQTNGIYQLNSSLGFSSLDQGRYVNDAGVTATMYVYCDLAGVGSKTKMDADVSNLAQNGMDRDLITSSNSASVGSQVIQFQKILNSNYMNTPRACIVRMLFVETKNTPRSNTVGVEFTNDISIEKATF